MVQGRGVDEVGFLPLKLHAWQNICFTGPRKSQQILQGPDLTGRVFHQVGVRAKKAVVDAKWISFEPGTINRCFVEHKALWGTYGEK